MIDYWARPGNWTHLWVTLRNLADLLRTLGDHPPADLLDAAADQAPDAPAGAAAAGAPPVDRAEALRAARQAIEAHLSG